MRAFLPRIGRSHFFQRATTPRYFTMSVSNFISSTSPNHHTDTSAASTRDSITSKPKKEILALPEAPHDGTGTMTLDMSNGDASIALDHLGPMVVNADGTLSRISNWDKLAEIEKKNTLRIIGARNQARLKVLREKEAVKGGDGGS